MHVSIRVTDGVSVYLNDSMSTVIGSWKHMSLLQSEVPDFKNAMLAFPEVKLGEERREMETIQACANCYIYRRTGMC